MQKHRNMMSILAVGLAAFGFQSPLVKADMSIEKHKPPTFGQCKKIKATKNDYAAFANRIEKRRKNRKNKKTHRK